MTSIVAVSATWSPTVDALMQSAMIIPGHGQSRRRLIQSCAGDCKSNHCIEHFDACISQADLCWPCSNIIHGLGRSHSYSPWSEAATCIHGST